MKKQQVQRVGKLSRGEGTRQALLSAGLELFGEFGVNGTTTRQLAKKAGVNIAAISYYFESKEGLYMAVVDAMLAELMEKTAFIRKETAKVGTFGKVSKDHAFTTLQTVLSLFSENFLNVESIRPYAKIVMREQTSPTAAFDRIYEKHISEMQRMYGKLVALCTGMDEESDAVKIRSHLLITQSIGLYVTYESLLRYFSVSELKEQHRELVSRILWSNTEAGLKNAGGVQ